MNWYGNLAEDCPHFDESFMNRIPRLGADARVRRTVPRGVAGLGFIKGHLVSVCHQPFSDLIVMMIRRLAPMVFHASASTSLKCAPF